MSKTRFKVTIEIEDDIYSHETMDDGDADSAVGRCIASCLGAIDETDGNLCLSMMLAETLKQANNCPNIMVAAGQAFMAHEIDVSDKNGTTWSLVVDESVVHDHRDYIHYPTQGKVSDIESRPIEGGHP